MYIANNCGVDIVHITVKPFNLNHIVNKWKSSKCGVLIGQIASGRLCPRIPHQGKKFNMSKSWVCLWCIHCTSNSNYTQLSAWGAVLLDRSLCSRRPSSGFLLAEGVCCGGDKAGTTACLKEEVGKAGRRGGGGRESHRKQAPSGVLNKLSPPHVYTSNPPHAPISSCRKLSGCNLPLALHW